MTISRISSIFKKLHPDWTMELSIAWACRKAEDLSGSECPETARKFLKWALAQYNPLNLEYIEWYATNRNHPTDPIIDDLRRVELRILRAGWFLASRGVICPFGVETIEELPFILLTASDNRWISRKFPGPCLSPFPGAGYFRHCWRAKLILRLKTESSVRSRLLCVP